MIGKILEKFGLTFDELTSEEKATLRSWSRDLQKDPLTIEKVREYVSSMISTVEHELTENDHVKHNSKHDLYLKARLRNYLLLKEMLAGPKRAKKAIEEAVSRIASS